MKKLMFSIFLFSIFISILTCHTSAVSYTVKEAGLTLDIPSNMIVFTQETDSSDPNFAKFKLNPDDFKANLKENSVFLAIWETDTMNEIMIKVAPYDDNMDFGNLSDAEYQEYTLIMKKAIEGDGFTVQRFERAENNQANFIKFPLSKPEADYTRNVVQYLTLNGHISVSISIESLDGPLTPDEEYQFGSLVSNATFQTNYKQNATALSFPYSNYEDEISFILPDGWEETNPELENSTLKSVFSATDGTGNWIAYHTENIYNKMTDEGKLNYLDLDCNHLTKEQLVGLLPSIQGDVTFKTYKGTQYFRTITSYIPDFVGSTTPINVTQFGCIRNGIYYSFLFNGVSNSANDKDLQQILKSVVFLTPAWETTETEESTEASEAEDTTQKSAPFSPKDFSWNVLITIFFYFVPVLLYRYGIRKKPLQPKHAMFVTMIYGFVVFLLAVILLMFRSNTKPSIGTIVVWSFVNYFLLQKGHQKTLPTQPIRQTINQIPISPINQTVQPMTNPVAQVNPTVVSPTTNPVSQVNPTVVSPTTNPVSQVNPAVVSPTTNPVSQVNPTVVSPMTNPVSPTVPITNRPQSVPIQSNGIPTSKKPSGIIYCSKCGTPLPEDSAFCFQCGSKVLKIDD